MQASQTHVPGRLIIADRGPVCGLIETHPRFPFYTLTGLMGTNIMELIYLTDE